MKSRTSFIVWTCFLQLTACTVTEEKIATWKESQNGPPKIRAAVRDVDLKLDLRVTAACALAELAHFDPLMEDLNALTAADKSSVTKALAERLLRRMEGTISKQATSRVQEQAKDSLFSLRKVFEPELRAMIDKRVATWILADWQRRRRGDHSGEKILAAIGKPAAPLIAEQVASEPAEVVVLARLVTQLGSRADVEKAATKLLALAQQQKASQSATLEALARMKTVKARNYLLKLATTSSSVLEVRKNALLALALCADASVVGKMSQIAQNTNEDGELRDAAMGVMDKVDSGATLEQLASILTGKDKILRYRAVEAMVACCKAKGVAKLLATFPSRYTSTKQDTEDYIEKDIKQLGKSALPPLRGALSSKSWLSRVVAVRLLGELGTKEDLPRLKELADDTTKLPGWGAGATVGAEAKAAIERLAKK